MADKRADDLLGGFASATEYEGGLGFHAQLSGLEDGEPEKVIGGTYSNTTKSTAISDGSPERVGTNEIN